jgi:hypothetical protein
MVQKASRGPIGLQPALGLVEKSAELAPVTVMLNLPVDRSPELLRVKLMGVLAVPTARDSKDAVVGVMTSLAGLGITVPFTVI